MKHLIRFRRAEQMQTLDEWNAELVLTNSDDAGCAYLLQVGIFRRLCSNGLVAAGEGFEAIRFRHAGLRTEEVVKASFQILASIPKLTASIDRFCNRPLPDTEAIGFAERALSIRYTNLEEAPINPRTLLSVRRPEDEPCDLWTILNRVQENLIRGGLSDERRDRKGRIRVVRSLRGLDSKISLNQSLWRLADQAVFGLN